MRDLDSLREAMKVYNSERDDLPDGSSITVPVEDMPPELQEDIDHNDTTTLALESAIDVEERYFEALVANGELLTEVDLGLEAINKGGIGLDDSTYRQARILHNNVSDNKLPALESALIELDGDRTELALGLEAAVVDRIKELWIRIKDSIIKMFRRIKDWYLRTWDLAPRLLQRAERIALTSTKIRGTAKETKIDRSGTRTLSLNGHAIEPQALVNSMGEVVKISTALIGRVAKDYNQLAQTLVKLTDDTMKKAIDDNKQRADETKSSGTQNTLTVPKVTMGETDKLLSQFITEWERLVKQLNLTHEPEKGDQRFNTENTVYRTSGALPGDQMFTAAYPDKAAEVAPELGRIKYSFGIGVVDIKQQKPDVSDKSSFKVLSLSDVDRIAEFCAKLCTLVMGYKKLYVERERVTDRLLKDTDTMLKRTDDLDATGRRNITSSVNGATTIHKTMTNGEGRWIKYIMNLVKHSLNWCEDSLRQYSEN